MIAVAFFALAGYVTATSVAALVAGVDVQHSTVGIVPTAASVVVMPFLSYAERRAGREVGSASAVADSKQTLVCTYLSAAVLVGLVLNSNLGGRGPTRSPPWSSPRSPCARESKRGKATPARPRSA